MNASRTYADEAYHQRAPNAQRRAHQNTEEYMSRATNYLNRNEFNQLKLPTVNKLGVLAPQTIAGRMKMRKNRGNQGGKRKKTRRKRKKTRRKTRKRKSSRKKHLKK